jgi:hypothetical protein
MRARKPLRTRAISKKKLRQDVVALRAFAVDTEDDAVVVANRYGEIPIGERRA